VAGEDSLANSFILSLLDTEVTTAQEFLQKWVTEHKFIILVFNNWYMKMVMVVFFTAVVEINNVKLHLLVTCALGMIIIITRKRSSCKCIATWGRPSHASLFPRLLRRHAKYEVAEPIYCRIIALLLLRHYFTLWPWPLTLWPWLWIYRCRDHHHHQHHHHRAVSGEEINQTVETVFAALLWHTPVLREDVERYGKFFVSFIWCNKHN